MFRKRITLGGALPSVEMLDTSSIDIANAIKSHERSIDLLRTYGYFETFVKEQKRTTSKEKKKLQMAQKKVAMSRKSSQVGLKKELELDDQ